MGHKLCPIIARLNMTQTSNNKDILLGTGNTAKQAMLAELIEGLPINPVTPQDLGLNSSPDETADSHEQVARDKAIQWSLDSGMLTIATDGGLVIPVLGSKWESLFTHRFAGSSATDSDRAEALLKLMAPYEKDDRSASWVEALAIAENGQVLTSWSLEGANGLIADHPGKNLTDHGFWVFSMWYFPRYQRTYDALTEPERSDLNDHWVQLKNLVHDYFLRTP